MYHAGSCCDSYQARRQLKSRLLAAAAAAAVATLPNGREGAVPWWLDGRVDEDLSVQWVSVKYATLACVGGW